MVDTVKLKQNGVEINPKTTDTVHLTGDETIEGVKSFTSPPKFITSTDTSVQVKMPYNVASPTESKRRIMITPLDTNTDLAHFGYEAKSSGLGRTTIGVRKADGTGWSGIYLEKTETGAYVSAPSRAYADAGSSDVMVKGHIGAITDLVHTTGNEEIAGNKTFTDSIVKTSTANINYAIILKNNLAESTLPTSDTASGVYMRPSDTDHNIGVVSHLLNKTSGDGKIELSSRNYKYDNKTSMFLVSPGDGTSPYMTGPSRTYSASNTSDIVNITSLQTSTDLVHTTGNEEIAGNKTFTSPIYQKGGSTAFVSYGPFTKGIIPDTNTYNAMYFKYDSGDYKPMFIAHYEMKDSGDGKVEISIRNYDYTNQKKFDIVSPGDGSAGYMTGPHRAYDATHKSDIVTIESLESRLDTVVQKNETDIINNVSSSETTKPLSANMGKELNTRIDNISSLGRYLSTWDCTTGLPGDNPLESPYTYKSGDYYVVSKVGTTNYRPNGESYTKDVPSTTAETGTVAVNDIYRYSSSTWVLQHLESREVTFSALTGNATDNASLSAALNGKASGTGTIGSATKPIYLKNGVITVSDGTVGSATQPVYLKKGALTVCTAIGTAGYLTKFTSTDTTSTASDSNIYTALKVDGLLTDGSVTKVGTATVGGGAKPVYLNAGVPTEISSTVGSATQLTYLSSGTITKGISITSGTEDPTEAPVGGVVGSIYIKYTE